MASMSICFGTSRGSCKKDMHLAKKPMTDQIKADRYLALKQAAKSKRRGLGFNKSVPPGPSNRVVLDFQLVFAKKHYFAGTKRCEGYARTL